LPFFNERDVEIPRLLNFVDEHSQNIKTILDVGCYGSQYLKQLKEKGKIVDGIDVHFGETKLGREKEFLRNYFVGNAVTYSPLGKYDLVICLSTLEHAGINGYIVKDFIAEQNSLFKKLIDASKRFIYVTFPYASTPSLQEGQCVNMTRDRLDTFWKAIPPTADEIDLGFYFIEAIHVVSGWTEIPQDIADKVEYDPAEGCRCVCILKVIL
jgi:hypothetical protein